MTLPNRLSLTVVNTCPLPSPVSPRALALEQELFSVASVSLLLIKTKQKQNRKQGHQCKNISFPFLAAVYDCALPFCGGSGTSTVNLCFVTRNQDARSHLLILTFDALLIKPNYVGWFAGLEK